MASLESLLHEVRRIEEHREILSEKKIRKIYQQLLKELKSFLGDYYVQYADSDGKLTVAILQQKMKYARFLEELADHVDSFTPRVIRTIRETVEETYQACYTGMVDSVANENDTEKAAGILTLSKLHPNVLVRAVQNPVSGLTLPDILEKQRRDVIYDIKQQANIGLMNGQRFEETARKVTERVEISYNKAITTVRTETHRVQEAGFMDCAMDIQTELDGSNLVYTATWHNVNDEKVRPRRRRGKKVYYKAGQANHVKMEGQTVKAGDYFDLGNGVKALAPGQSGDAENDINCRCFLGYNIMTVAEFETKTGVKLKNKS